MTKIAIDKLTASNDYPPLCNELLFINSTSWKIITQEDYFGKMVSPALTYQKTNSYITNRIQCRYSPYVTKPTYYPYPSEKH